MNDVCDIDMLINTDVSRTLAFVIGDSVTDIILRQRRITYDVRGINMFSITDVTRTERDVTSVGGMNMFFTTDVTRTLRVVKGFRGKNMFINTVCYFGRTNL